MKKFLKILGWSLATLVAILILVAVWALQKVDYTPYWETPWYAATRARLDSITHTAHPERGRLYAGFAKVSITPRLGAPEDDPRTGAFRVVPLAGFGDREGRPAEGIHDSIFVRAIALSTGRDTLVLIASDILIVPENVSSVATAAVHKKTGLRRRNLFFSATHTHSSVGAWSDKYVGKEFAGDPNGAVVTWLAQQYSAAIAQAVQDLQPAALASGTLDLPQYVKNRLVGDKGFKNGQFAWLTVQQAGGRRAVLGSYAGHPTTLGGWNMLISGDYPGYWERRMEKNGYDLAAFFAGPVGSHSVRSRGEKFDKPKFVGETLADSLLQHISSPALQDTLTLESLTLQMALPPFHVRVTDNLRLRPSLVKKIFPPVGDVCLQTARLGDMIWITAPCDFSGELALDYQAAAEARGLKAMVTSFNGAYVGYIIPDKYYHLNEYESRLMSWFGPYTGPYFDEMIRRMMRKL